jgi:hypothetical protein
MKESNKRNFFHPEIGLAIFLVVIFIGWVSFFFYPTFIKNPFHSEISKVCLRPENLKLDILSSNHSNVNAVMAGFAITAIILLLSLKAFEESAAKKKQTGIEHVQEATLVLFALAFVGSLETAIFYSISSGIDLLFLTNIRFSISSLLFYFSILTLLGALTSFFLGMYQEKASLIAWIMFLGTIVMGFCIIVYSFYGVLGTKKDLSLIINFLTPPIPILIYYFLGGYFKSLRNLRAYFHLTLVLGLFILVGLGLVYAFSSLFPDAIQTYKDFWSKFIVQALIVFFWVIVLYGEALAIILVRIIYQARNSN